MTGKNLICLIVLLLLTFVVGANNKIFAQSTSFTYQGRLQDSGANANGSYDFQFTLWDALSGGTQQPQPTPVTVTKSTVAVAGGVFTVQLDFGSSAFPGPDRFLETSVRLSGGGTFTLLSPRQPITSTPYAIRSASASSADAATNATQLGGVAANQYVITSDSRLSDPRAPTAGSSNYIQNTAPQQASSNFNISGNGTAAGTLTANIVSAAAQYNLSGNRILIASGNSIFVGFGAGQTNTGSNNSFFGFQAGVTNTSGSNNAFFGRLAGASNDGGNLNSFFGTQVGVQNTSGNNNAFFGRSAGSVNTTNSFNAYFGTNTGANSDACCNSMFGNAAGVSNTSGQANAFFGDIAGNANITGSNNTALGTFADFGSSSLTNATAVGYKAMVSQDNSLVLGSIAGVNGASANTNVGIGTTNPLSRLHVVGDSFLAGTVYVGATTSQVTLGSGANGSEIKFTNLITPFFSIYNTPGPGRLTIADTSAGGAGTPLMSITSSGNVGIGTTSPLTRLHVHGNAGIIGNVGIGTTLPSSTLDVLPPGGQNVFIGGGGTTGSELKLTNSGTAHFSIYNSGNSNLTFANTSSLLSANTAGTPLMVITSAGNVGMGGVTSPTSKLQVNGQARFSTVNIDSYVGGQNITLCTASSGVNQNIIGLCSSSLRYKTNVQSFRQGLDIVRRLQPVSFDWKEAGTHDVGLAAEDVEKVEPLLTFRNDKGEIEGVKYNQLSAVFINAFKEQQVQINQQQEQLKQQRELIKRQQNQAKQQSAELQAQQQQLDALKKLLCRSHPHASVCK